MKRLMNNLFFLAVFISTLFMCKNKDQISDKFILEQNEYWRYSDSCQSYGVYFKFNKSGDYDKYNRYIDGGFELFNNDGDLISDKRSWSIKNDSVFVWDLAEYKIALCTNDKIILSYEDHKDKDKKCAVILEKVIDE